MNETEHMPRCTLTLVDSAGDMKPSILMDADRAARVAYPATPKGFRAYATVTDPLTGRDHRVSGFGHTHVEFDRLVAATVPRSTNAATSAAL